MDEYSEYWDSPYFYEDEQEQLETTFYQIYKFCLKPTLHEVLPHICKLLFLNFVFRFVTQIKPVSIYFYHIISTICGVTALYCISSSVLIISIFIVISYVLVNIIIFFQHKYWPYYISFLCIVYLILSEFYFPLPHLWTESRGMHMLAIMKIISIGFDMKKGTIKSLPDPMAYFGYMFCPSNCIFGPWISFNTYKVLFTSHSVLYDLNWIKHVVTTTVISMVFLTLSNCWAYYLIPQTWSWLVAYQEAFSFRTSHYFVSYLSEASMYAGGFGSINLKKKKESLWSFEVTKPFMMEFPRSLVQVVVFWNIPMHMWLKNYVFQVCKPMGSFFAVIMTYVISSLLHGFNLKLAAVLLSLGFYTYIEYKFRYKLSVIFDACIGANPCKKCEHTYKNNIYVKMTNFMFGVIAIFHLAYLGCLLDTTSETDTYYTESYSDVFLKWKQLDYASHLFTVFMFIIYKLI